MGRRCTGQGPCTLCTLVLVQDQDTALLSVSYSTPESRKSGNLWPFQEGVGLKWLFFTRKGEKKSQEEGSRLIAKSYSSSWILTSEYKIIPSCSEMEINVLSCSIMEINSPFILCQAQLIYKSMQAADSWHYLAKQWLIVTDFPDGHSNNWRRATNPAIRFHLAEDSTTAVFSFPTHSSRAFCCSSGLLSMQQIQLQWAGKSSSDDALLSSPPSPSTLLCISLHYSCTGNFGGGSGLNASACSKHLHSKVSYERESKPPTRIRAFANW